MPFIVATKRPGAEPIPREFWRGIPCGHPDDPVAAYALDGSAACHCGCLLFLQDALSERPPEAPGPIVPCSKCGCYVAVPESPTVVVSRRAVATLEEAGEAYHEALFVCGIEPPTEVWDRWAMAWYEHVSESGGSVGPLPDGSLIAVELVDIMRLWREAGEPDTTRTEVIIAAFNAKQTTP